MKRHEQQRLADKAHHEQRIKWLSVDSPRWADGTPVSKHHVFQMLNASRDALRMIVDHGMSTNIANVDDWLSGQQA